MGPRQAHGFWTLPLSFWSLEGSQQAMNRNVPYLVIGALVVVSVIFGYQLYQERQKTTGAEISIGDRGISIEKK